MENQYSMLPQPTSRSVGGVVKALNEVSESDNNARNVMPPPSSTNTLKRQGSNLPEPAQKRKTLVERAGETSKPLSSTLSRPTSAASQHALSNTSLYRSSSNTSGLSRSTSVSSRTTSNSTYTGSLNSGIRPPTITSATGTIRPKSSYAKEKPFAAAPRPNAAIANLQASHEVFAKSKHSSLSELRDPRTVNTATRESRSRYLKPYDSMRSLKRNAFQKIPPVVIDMRDRNRDVSISAQLQSLRMDSFHFEHKNLQHAPARSPSPSRIPKASPMIPVTPTPTPRALNTPVLRHKSTMKQNRYLTYDSDLEGFDPDEKYNDFKRMFEDYKQMYQDSMTKIDSAREESSISRDKMVQLEQERTSQSESMISLKADNQNLQYQLESSERNLQELRRDYDERLQELKKAHQKDSDALRQQHRAELESAKAEQKKELRDLKQCHHEELELERKQKVEALNQFSTQGVLDKQRHELDLERKEQRIAAAMLEIEHLTSVLDREKQASSDLRETLRSAGDVALNMETNRQGLQAKIAYLESDSKSQSEAYAEMEKRMNEAIAKADQIEEKLRIEETIRRKLHNQVQELKGNIRVFCRVRPTLTVEEDLAAMKFPQPDESTEIEVRGLDERNSLGKDVTKSHPFTFDRVFDPGQTNDHVYSEISQLIQSALDGYNVCIFAYGQTGSGKTFTMSSEDGMIPRALRQIYSRSRELEGRGWAYQMQGSFVEVYNEEIRDLLGDAGDKKHEVHHDMQNHETIITNATSLSLDNQEQVESILAQAMSRRSVAATKANEHSSRSHSVFILKLVGKNNITGEVSKGTLNLVDLAGSERIKNAETSGQRLKETQSINKSLSCLGDVIGALGQGQAGADSKPGSTNNRESLSMAHIPYRNSKLTYLLQLSLGGNCKTLMFVMVAPEKKCLGETITSLKFAEKVSRTRVGVAKKAR